MTTCRRGRALSAAHERIAREHAAYVIERYTSPRAELAQEYRDGVRLNVDRRQYQWAGFFRRVAELIEGDLWGGQP